MRFTKLQGAGNDFVLVETNDTNNNWSSLAIAMCNRHFGIGADGLVLLMPSDRADCKMRIIDCDGTEAEACGNGLRCLIKHYADVNPTSTGRREISVETIVGTRKAMVNEVSNNENRIQAGMGRPEFGEEEIPVRFQPQYERNICINSMITCTVTVDSRELELSLVSMGNPHAVYFSDQTVADFPLSHLGPKMEYLGLFPNRVNFEVVRVIDRQQIEARVWERGVGETLACGSGACAITVAAQLRGYIDNEVAIKLPGGTLEVEWDGVGEVLLSGPAETVFSGEWQDNNL